MRVSKDSFGDDNLPSREVLVAYGETEIVNVKSAINHARLGFGVTQTALVFLALYGSTKTAIIFFAILDKGYFSNQNVFNEAATATCAIIGVLVLAAYWMLIIIRKLSYQLMRSFYKETSLRSEALVAFSTRNPEVLTEQFGDLITRMRNMD